MSNKVGRPSGPTREIDANRWHYAAKYGINVRHITRRLAAQLDACQSELARCLLMGVPCQESEQ